MDQSPAWEVCRSSANREPPRSLWNSKGHYHIYKRPPSVLILSTASQPMSPDFFASNEFQIIGPNERKFSKWFRLCVISGFRRSINKICAFWEFYTALISSFVPTFRNKQFYHHGFAWPLNTGPINCPETSIRYYHSTLRKIPKKRRPLYRFS